MILTKLMNKQNKKKEKDLNRRREKDLKESKKNLID